MLRKVLIVSFVFNIIFLISLLCALWRRGHFHPENTENRPKCNGFDKFSTLNVTDGQFCFSCNLESNVQPNETLYSGVFRFGDKKQLCCARSDRHTREIVSKVKQPENVFVLDIYHRKEEVQGGLIAHLRTQAIHSAQRVLKHRAKDNSDRSTYTRTSQLPWFSRRHAIHTRLSFSAGGKITWLADGQESSFQNGVSLVENRLQVQKEGLYFIYAAITHNVSIDVVESFYHTISKRHRSLPKNGQQILLMDKNGGGDIPNGLLSSFLCGSFNLKEGHEISVHISNINNVDTTMYSNYCGMFIL